MQQDVKTAIFEGFANPANALKGSMQTIAYILAVDDVPANLVALEAMLKRDDVVIRKASSGEEALELLLEHEFALALLDVQMPGMNGFELAELMRGTERTRQVPIIFLTAGDADSRRQFRGYEAGAVDFILKPVQPDVLRSKVQVFVDLFLQRRNVAAERDGLADIAVALAEADDAKDQFLAILAHELRNPVAALMSGLDLLDRPRTEEGSREIRSQMRRMVSHLGRLVEDLLDVSRIKEGKFALRLAPLDLRDVAALALEGSGHAVRAGGHRLMLDIPDRPLEMTGDFSRLAQVLANLLVNAAKYTPTGGNLSLSIQDAGEAYSISVSDDGVGIPPAMQSRIFEKFAQIERAGSSLQGGLGLGLALVRHLVDQHGGTISVISEGEGKGANFILTLPKHPLIAVDPAA